MRPPTTESRSSSLDLPRETVDHDTVNLRVDYVLKVSEKPHVSVPRHAAFEYRELNSFSIALTYVGDLTQPMAPRSIRVGNVVCDEDVHQCLSKNGGYVGMSPRK